MLTSAAGGQKLYCDHTDVEGQFPSTLKPKWSCSHVLFEMKFRNTFLPVGHRRTVFTLFFMNLSGWTRDRSDLHGCEPFSSTGPCSHKGEWPHRTLQRNPDPSFWNETLTTELKPPVCVTQVKEDEVTYSTVNTLRKKEAEDAPSSLYGRVSKPK